MSNEITCLLTSPTFHGGTETAMFYTKMGLESIGYDVQSLAVRLSARSPWTNMAKSYVTPVSKKDIQFELDKSDQIVLSNTYFADPYTRDAVAKTNTSLTSGWHGDDVMKTMLEAHNVVKNSPGWSGQYVKFWDTAFEDSDVAWQKAVLPYKPRSTEVEKTSVRPYDFGFIGRIDPRKGAWGFAVAVDILSTFVSHKQIACLMAGAPNDLPGGPHIWFIRQMLEEQGWVFVETGKNPGTMKATWIARKNKTTLHYTGAYQADEVSSILESVDVFVNMTSLKASSKHFEYATLEAVSAGCYPFVPMDFDVKAQYGYDFHGAYIPTAAIRIEKGTRTVFNDLTADTRKNTYRQVAQKMQFLFEGSSFEFFRTHGGARRNLSAITKVHDPAVAAKAYVAALS